MEITGYLDNATDASFRYRIYQLDDTPLIDEKSLIRHIAPDYILGVAFDDDKDFINEFRYYLNYGDLYLAALNAIEQPKAVFDETNRLLPDAENAMRDFDEFYKDVPTNPTGRLIDKSNFFKKYPARRSAMEKYIFSASIASILRENTLSDGMLAASVHTPLLQFLPITQEEFVPSGVIEFAVIRSTTAEEFKKKLKKSFEFKGINVNIRYLNDGTEQYTFENMNDLIIFEIRNYLKQGKDIKICENCGKFFIPATRSDEKYCDFEFQYDKTCKQIAFSQKLKKDEILNSYRTIYKTQNARKQRNAHCPNIAKRFDIWKTNAKKALIKCQSGELTLDEMKAQISSADWIKGGDTDA